ncbi:unnamed protein product [Phytophthora fragariaefolia]|uniref:Unnamed protein product n=1 Tax=Phytophthora fragariaefolia TaxID=1490495 RepID=A0A9W7DCD5_9STRA|nr:unnamed protein product [Phytophthora fragariaefolia]
MLRRTSGRHLSAREQAEAVVAERQERRIELEQYVDHYSSRPLHAVEDDDTDMPIMDPFRDVGGSEAKKIHDELLNVLWRIRADKYRLARDLLIYDGLFRLCMGLTKAHIAHCSFRLGNGERYRQAQDKLFHIGNRLKKKRRLAQAKYRAKQQQRNSSTSSDLRCSQERRASSASTTLA